MRQLLIGAFCLTLISFSSAKDGQKRAGESSDVAFGTALQKLKGIASSHPAKALAMADSLRPFLADDSRMLFYSVVLADLLPALQQRSMYAQLLLLTKELVSVFPYETSRREYLQIKASQGESLVYLWKGDSAVQVLDECFEMLKHPSDSFEQSVLLNLYMSRGILHGMGSQTAEALFYFKKADSMAFLLHDDVRSLMVLGYMGNVHSILGQYELAIQKLETAAEKAVALGRNGVAFSTYDNLANCYVAEGRFEDAINALAKARTYGEKTGDSTGIAINYDITGYTYTNWGKPGKAIPWLLKSIEIHETLGQREGTLKPMIHLAEAYRAQKRYQDAIDVSNKQLQLADELGQSKEVMHAYFNLWHAYDSLGNLDSAYHCVQWYWWLKDSLNESNFSDRVAKFQNDIENQAKENQIELLGLENELFKERDTRRANWNLWLTISSVLVLFIAIVSTYLLVKIRKGRKQILMQNERLKLSDNEKALLLKELHHRVKNNLQIVSSLLNLQGQSVKDLEAQAAFKEGQNRVDAMAMIHRHLYSTNELTAVDVSSYLERLVNSLAYSYGFNRSNFRLNSNITQKPVDVDVAIPIGLIINELISNTFKHAFDSVGMAEIDLQLKIDDDNIVIHVHDNGRGLPSDFSVESASSFGLELVYTLVKQLKGSIQHENKNGALFIIQINQSKAMAA